MATRSVAIFNLERTITEAVYGDAVMDISALGIGPELTPETRPSTVREQREAFLHWTKLDRGQHFDRLLDHTAEQAPSRVADWAKVMMAAQASVGRDIAIFSNGTAHDLVKAYADGISNGVAGVDVSLWFGRRFVTAAEERTDMTRSFNKSALAERLLEHGCRIPFIADSFVRASHFTKLGERAVYANLDVPAQTFRIDRVFWHKNALHLAKIVLAGESEPTTPLSGASYSEGQVYFDLEAQAERDEFVQLLTRNDPAFAQ